jgi:hypothetical integral membrane protein (TIGR02206 family)
MFSYFFTYDADIPRGLEVENFSPTHLAWLAVTILLMVLSTLWYRRLHEKARRKVLRGAAYAVIGLEVLRTAWLLIIGHYEIYRHLPLHLCGVMIVIEAVAVFSGKRFFKEFAYAAGLPGAAMALLTPEPSGYPFFNIQYLQSIVIHALLVLIPVFMIAGDGFRPNIRALPKNLGLLTALAAFCFGINFLLNSNYMFVRFAPADTPIALFDSWVGWPGYIGLLLAFVFVVWVIMYLPWALAGMRKKRDVPA